MPIHENEVVYLRPGFQASSKEVEHAVSRRLETTWGHTTARQTYQKTYSSDILRKTYTDFGSVFPHPTTLVQIRNCIAVEDWNRPPSHKERLARPCDVRPGCALQLVTDRRRRMIVTPLKRQGRESWKCCEWRGKPCRNLRGLSFR